MVSTVERLLVLLVAAVHIAIGVTEMFFWDSPIIHSRFDLSLDEARKVASIVANAGLYNGFLAAGLIWGLLSGARGYQTKLFFLICVIVAGIFGAVTLKWTTLVLQTAPAALALLIVWVSRHATEPGSAPDSGGT